MQNNTHRKPRRFLKIKTVSEQVAKSTSAIYADVAAGKFPAPVKIGPRASAFLSDEVEAWMEEQVAKSRQLSVTGSEANS